MYDFYNSYTISIDYPRNNKHLKRILCTAFNDSPKTNYEVVIPFYKQIIKSLTGSRLNYDLFRVNKIKRQRSHIESN